MMGSVFLQGLALSLGLIVAIGAQNAFVLRQGLRRALHQNGLLANEEGDGLTMWALSGILVLRLVGTMGL